MTKAQCIVFDIDDTLYLERDYVRSGFDAVGLWVHAQHGTSEFGDLAWALFEGGRRGDIFDVALRELQLPSDTATVKQLVDVYRSHCPRISLLPDAERCLGAVRPRAKLGVVSDGWAAAQRRKVQALGLGALTDAVVLTGELGAEFAKPHARAFEELESRFAVAGHDCVYVADNPLKDFVAPRRLGWRTVRVQRPQGLYSSAVAASDEYDATDTVPDLDEALERRLM